MKAVRTTLQNALAIVGVSAPEKCNEEKRKRLVQNRGDGVPDREAYFASEEGAKPPSILAAEAGQ